MKTKHKKSRLEAQSLEGQQQHQKDIFKVLDTYHSPQRWIEALMEDMKSYLAQPVAKPRTTFSLFQDIK